MTTPLYYSRSLQESLLLASSMASAEGHSSFGVAHLVLALLHESSSSGLRDLICSMHKDLTYVMEWFDTYRELYVPKEEDKDTENAWGADNDVLHLLEESERSKIKLGQEELDGLCVLLAVVRRGVVYSDSQLQSLELEEEELLRFFEASESIFLMISSASYWSPIPLCILSPRKLLVLAPIYKGERKNFVIWRKP